VKPPADALLTVRCDVCGAPLAYVNNDRGVRWWYADLTRHRPGVVAERKRQGLRRDGRGVWAFHPVAIDEVGLEPLAAECSPDGSAMLSVSDVVEAIAAGKRVLPVHCSHTAVG
jgi:hypothetical protein